MRKVFRQMKAGMSWRAHPPFNGELEEPDPSVVWIKRPGSCRNLRSNLRIGIRILDSPSESLEGTEQPQVSLDMLLGQVKTRGNGGNAG